MLTHFIHSIGIANFWSLITIYCLLILGTVVIYALRFKSNKQRQAELVARIKSWWVIIVLFTFALCISKVTMIIFFAFISYLALKEYFTIIPTRRVDRRVLFLVYLSLPLQYVWVGMHWYGMFIIFIPVYLFLLIPFRMVTIGDTKGFLNASGTLHWGAMLTIYCISYVAFLGVLPTQNYQQGLSFIIYLTFLTQLNDIAQYCWGKLFGKKPIAPTVSPNKTIAGLIGGIITTTVVACLVYPWLTPFTLTFAVYSGLIISIAGFIGDLTLSAVKRDLGIKDTGKMLPGHGGILDRMDSLIFTAPLFFHFVRYFYY